MARVETIIVGGGISPGTPFTVNGIPYVEQASPPFIATTDFLSVVPTGANKGVIVGTDPDNSATELLRMNGGVISRPATTATASNVIGKGATVANALSGGVAIGDNAVISAGSNSTVVGANSSSANPNGSTIVGATSTIGAGYNAGVTVVGTGIAIGAGSGGVSGDLTFIGRSVTLTGGTNFNSVVIATAVAISAGLGRSVLIGGSDGAGSVGASCDSNVVIGYRFIVAANKSNSISVGAQNSVQHNSVILIGGNLTSFADNQCLIGGPQFSGFINSVVIGSGDTNGTQHDVTVRLTNATGADKPGNALTVQAGLATGAGASGPLNLNVSVTAGSSSILNASRTGVRVSYTPTAGETYLMVYDVDNATLERVTVGAADSGGAGFKVLRIPN